MSLEEITMGSILHDLGIEPGALLMNGISFIVLLWLMARFMFKPVGSFMEQRRARIHQTLDEADAERQKAAAERADVQSQRGTLMQQASEAAEQHRRQAAEEADRLRAAAREQARETERIAHAATQREADEVAGQLRSEVGVAAAAMSRRILAQTLTGERHNALLEQFIADVEAMAAREQDPS
jgi:F-type H+-transporting ATPase subunit b